MNTITCTGNVVYKKYKKHGFFRAFCFDKFTQKQKATEIGCLLLYLIICLYCKDQQTL